MIQLNEQNGLLTETDINHLVVYTIYTAYRQVQMNSTNIPQGGIVHVLT